MVEISEYIIAFAIFTLAVGLGVGMIVEMSASKPDFVNQTTFTAFNNSMNKYNQLEGNITKLKGDITAATPDDSSSFLGAVNSLIKVGWFGIKYVLSSFTFLGDVYDGITTILPIPKIVGGILILISSLLIIFAIWKAIFRSPL